MLESEIYQESFIGVVVDDVHCVTEWDSSSNNKIVQLFVLFVCVIFVTRNFSGAPAARMAAERSPIIIMQGKDKGNP